MANALTTSPKRALHDPARMTDSRLDGVPEDWRRAMQLERPNEGVDICCISGRPCTNWAFQAEGGPALSLCILLEGHVEAAIDDGAELCIGPGQAMLMAIGQHISGWDVFSTDRDFRLVNINLSEPALQGLTGLHMDDLLACMRAANDGLSHINVGMTFMPAFSTLQRVASEISHCRYPGCRAKNAFLCAKVAEALAAVLDKYSREQGSIPKPNARAVPSDRPKLIQAHQLLETRYHEAWSVQSLAQAVGLNEKRLQAGFQALYGSTVHEYLTHTRLDMALALLSRGHSVTHTAQAVGFANISHFSRVFRSIMGISPKRWAHGHLPGN